MNVFERDLWCSYRPPKLALETYPEVAYTSDRTAFREDDDHSYLAKKSRSSSVT